MISDIPNDRWWYDPPEPEDSYDDFEERADISHDERIDREEEEVPLAEVQDLPEEKER